MAAFAGPCSRICQSNPPVAMAEAVVSERFALMSAPVAAGDVTDLFVVGERGIATSLYKPLKMAKARSLFSARAGAAQGRQPPGHGECRRSDDGPDRRPPAERRFYPGCRTTSPSHRPRALSSCAVSAKPPPKTRPLPPLLRELELFQPAVQRNLTDKRMPHWGRYRSARRRRQRRHLRERLGARSASVDGLGIAYGDGLQAAAPGSKLAPFPACRYRQTLRRSAAHPGFRRFPARCGAIARPGQARTGIGLRRHVGNSGAPGRGGRVSIA